MVERDAKWFGPEWHTSRAYTLLAHHITRAHLETPWQWRLAVLLYVVERDVRQRDLICPYTTGPGAQPLPSIRTQGQWLSAILLYQLRLAFEALPGVQRNKPLVAAVDADKPHGGANSMTLPLGISTPVYPTLVWSKPPAEALDKIIPDPYYLETGRLDIFARVFAVLGRPDGLGSETVLVVPPPRVDVKTMVTSNDLPWSMDNVVNHAAGLDGTFTNMPWAWPPVMPDKGEEPNAREMVEALGPILRTPDLGFLAEQRLSNSFPSVPTLGDYKAVCRVLDASRSPILEQARCSSLGRWTHRRRQVYATLVPIRGTEGGSLFGFTLPTDRLLLNGEVRPGFNVLLADRRKEMQVGTLHEILRQLLPAIGKIDYGTGLPLDSSGPVGPMSGEYVRIAHVVTRFLPGVLGLAFPNPNPGNEPKPGSELRSDVARLLVLPAATNELARATKDYLTPTIGPRHVIRVAYPGGPPPSLPLQVLFEPVAGVSAPAPAPVVVEGAKPVDVRKEAAKLALARNIRAHADFITHLERLIRQPDTPYYLESEGLQRAGMLDLINTVGMSPVSLWAASADWLEHIQELTPWATLALLVDLIHWAFTRDDEFMDRLRRWTAAVGTVEAKLQRRLGLDLSTATTLAELLRLDPTPNPAHVRRPEISGRAYFTPQFIALLHLGLAFMERNVSVPRPSLEDLTAIRRHRQLATAFGEYLAALEAKSGLRKPRQYKTTKVGHSPPPPSFHLRRDPGCKPAHLVPCATTKVDLYFQEYGFFNVPLQEAEHHLLDQTEVFKRGGGRTAPPPSRAKKWAIK